ncbi:MAG: phosphate signaling complex protein PhoU [Tannerellaceae bacterium]|jgi:phosphate transport system protein|nr:phosphate signaling complex protein PhoU [Tannerellaceae bacterium]
MKHNEKELNGLKEEVGLMWELVISQLEKAKAALLGSDVALAREIVSREKRVDAFEIKIDSDCENYIALYNPVAIDLRLVLSLIKLSITLERIGDFCEGIARHVADEECNEMGSKLAETLQIGHMFDVLLGMLKGSYEAFEGETTEGCGEILRMDDEVDKVYRSSLDIIGEYIRKQPDLTNCGLRLVLLVRKLERIGDHCSNIVEEIVFYVDAKVLKHGGGVHQGGK